MSLLEDIFLVDEANEAQELERVIEGDEYDERPRSPMDDEREDGGNPEDEAEEDKRRVDPTSTKTKRVTKNPRFILNPARLTGPRGIQVIPEHFKDFKFKGKGHEKEDLDMVLKKLEHWAYRLYPKFQFADCLKKIETLGKKRPVMVHLHKIRTDQFLSEETVVQKDSSDDEAAPPQEEDEFDKLLQQQIDLARATPAPGSVKKVVDKNDQWSRVIETPRADRTLLPMPKATSSPSISDEQKERMVRNRKLAEERRLARLKQATTTIDSPPTIIEIDEAEVIKVDNETITPKKHRKNVIDSSDSDDDCNVSAVNESVVVDVHNGSGDKKGDDRILDDQMCDDKGVEKADNVDVHNETDVVDVHNDSGDKENDNTMIDDEVCDDRSVKKGDKLDDKDKFDVREVNEADDKIKDDEMCDDRLENGDKVDEIKEITVDREDSGDDNASNSKGNIELSNIIDNNEENNHQQLVNIKPNEENTGTDIPKNISASNDIEITKEATQEDSKPTEELVEDIMDVDFSDDF